MRQVLLFFLFFFPPIFSATGFVKLDPSLPFVTDDGVEIRFGSNGAVNRLYDPVLNVSSLLFLGCIKCFAGFQENIRTLKFQGLNFLFIC